jgi:hypothetical protein
MIFVMGPSEPLIPLLFYSGLNILLLKFCSCSAVYTYNSSNNAGNGTIGRYGYSTLFNTEKLERYMGVVSGAVVTVCGIGMVFLGW